MGKNFIDWHFMIITSRVFWLKYLGKVYLVYLGLVPCLATLAILWLYGHPSPFLVFLGGVIAVSVYLAATYSYTHIPGSLLTLIFILIDGPIFVFLSLRQGLNPLSFAIEGYLIEGTVLWLSILILAVTSPLPTIGQRVGSVLFMLAALGTTTSLFWPYIQTELWGHPRSIWLALGMVQSAVVQFAVLRRDEVIRSGDDGILYIVGFLFLWLFSMFAGAAIHGNINPPNF
jgi:hypothetical protein